jgi:peptide/nickel transport system substrate-binding protein
MSGRETDPSSIREDGVREDRGITRAQLLRRAAATGAFLAGADLLAACGGASSGSATSSTTAQGTPKRGGHFRVGMIGNGTAETLNPTVAVVAIDAARAYNLFDGLVWCDQSNVIQPRLAVEWMPNSDATVWTIKLRQGVTWHDGKTFTADDVIYSLRAMGSPTNFGNPSVVNIKLRDLKKINPYELQVPLLSPDARLLDLFAYFNQVMIQDGEKTFSHPVGTGPFMYQSFTAGRQSIFTRNPNYWMTGKPYVDSLEIISITDDSARLNALQSGQVDAMDSLAFPDAKANLSGGSTINVLNASTPTFYTFYMNCAAPPFNDVRVRQAMMAAVNRQALINDALDGFGTLGNDIGGKGLPFFDSGLPQKTQDIEKAKSLLKAAGHTTLQVTLSTSPLFVGFVESATVLAQQVSAAGFQVQLKTIQPSQYLTPPPGGVYLKLPFGQDKWPVPSLRSYYTQALTPNAPYAETHFADPTFQKLLSQAIGTIDPTKAQDYWNQVQTIQYNEGGNLIFAQPNNIDATSKKVAGLKPGGPFELGGFSFWDVYFV